MLFDESHKAKNLVAGDEDAERGKTKKPAKSTKMALTVQNLQASCPKARVVYCSATGAPCERITNCAELSTWHPMARASANCTRYSKRP